MKKTLLLLMCLALAVTAFVGCNRRSAEPPTEEINQLIEPAEDWENTLIKYLAQFSPIFHNVRYEETEWWSGWQSDWYDFVEWLGIGYLHLDNHGYGYNYIYRNLITGERLVIDDTPFLNQRFGVWHDDDGELRQWSQTEIANRFDLFDFDESGIPTLVIYWSSPDNEPFQAVTLHRFRNGTFEVSEEISEWQGVDFYRANDGRLLIRYYSTVAHMIEISTLHLNGEITIEPTISTDGWTSTVYNHLTSEVFERYELGGQIIGIEFDTHEGFYSALLGFSVTRVEPMTELQERITELILTSK